MITRLHNPKTDFYLEFKSLVLGDNFHWYWNNTSHGNQHHHDGENYGFFSHLFLERPGYSFLYPKPNSQFVELAHKLFIEIACANNIDAKVIYRINANMTVPLDSKNKYGPLHTDHEFPHKNMIVYLTDCNGGGTMVSGEKPYYGQEDDVIIFEGEHQAGCPKFGRRVVLVYTFNDFN